MRRLIVSIFAVFVFCAMAGAQPKKVSGNVSDDKNEVLPGTIVMVKSTSGDVKETVTTDVSGNYEVSCQK